MSSFTDINILKTRLAVNKTDFFMPYVTIFNIISFSDCLTFLCYRIFLLPVFHILKYVQNCIASYMNSTARKNYSA